MTTYAEVLPRVDLFVIGFMLGACASMGCMALLMHRAAESVRRRAAKERRVHPSLWSASSAIDEQPDDGGLPRITVRRMPHRKVS